MQENASLVVIGAGIVGCSAAYHLTRLGWSDIAVLEQGSLFETGGSTSHAPGLVFQTNFSQMMTGLARYTVELYSALELEEQPCFHPVGSMEIACTRERWEDFKRKCGAAHSWGVEAELLEPGAVADKIPLLDSSKIHGAYYAPGDGIAKPVRAAAALARATVPGATFYDRTTVVGIEVEKGRVQAVLTDQGRLSTDKVLICAGIWGPRLGRMAGVSIPLAPMQHLYARTAPLTELAGERREVVHPILRHQDAALYYRQVADCYGIGSYRHEPLLVDPDDLLSHAEARVTPSIMEFTPGHFEAALAATAALLPGLAGAELDYKINGLFSFTPDGMPLVGESSRVRGVWVAEAVWITHAGGVGRAVAEWMAQGTPGMDLREADLNRFAVFARTPDYVKTRGAQQYREVYDIIHPLQQIENPRQLRLSPFYERQRALGAVFFESAGWERPQWFEANEGLAQSGVARSGWEARYWSPIQGGEHQALRQGVGLFDLSAFAKIEISGAGALEFLQYIAANQMDRPEGVVVYTSMLNKRGGIECDLTVTRLEDERFLVLTGGSTGARDLAWLRRQAPTDGSVQIEDITSQYCGLGLWGPLAREVLQQVCDADLSNAAFPYFRARRLALGVLEVLALRVSYVGELGWEIYAPTEYGIALWDLLWAVGRTSGMIALGSGAFDSLRLEKGYRLWGADIHSDYNPYEAGLGWAVKLGKGDFQGREELVRIRARGIQRQLCCMILDEPGAAVLGKEPIRAGEQVLGYVTSANYGYSVGKYIVYGYLPRAYAAAGTRVEVEYFDRCYSATVAREPLYDQEGLKLGSSG